MKSSILYTLVLFAMASSGTARPFTFIDAEGNCPAGMHWSVHSCQSSLCTVTNRAFRTLCGADNTAAELDASAWGFWMWVREGLSKEAHFWEQGTCDSPADTGDWIDSGSFGGNDKQNFDWVATLGGDGGRHSKDGTDICFFGDHDHFVNSDIRMARDGAWADAPNGSRSGFLSCIATGSFFRETVMMHEVGHSYGIGHNDGGWPTLMRSSVGPTGGCNRATNFHSQPDADAQAGVVFHHGRNTNNVVNFSASPEFMSGTTVTSTSRLWGAYCGAGFSLKITVYNYYASAPTWKYQFVVAPDGIVPSITDPVWWSPVNTVVNSQHNMNATVTHTITPPSNVLSPSVTYRVWAVIDAGSEILESDEGDNWIPTGVRLVRGTGC